MPTAATGWPGPQTSNPRPESGASRSRRLMSRPPAGERVLACRLRGRANRWGGGRSGARGKSGKAEVGAPPSGSWGRRRRGASLTDDNAARRRPSARDAAPPIRAASKAPHIRPKAQRPMQLGNLPDAADRSSALSGSVSWLGARVPNGVGCAGCPGSRAWWRHPSCGWSGPGWAGFLAPRDIRPGLGAPMPRTIALVVRGRWRPTPGRVPLGAPSGHDARAVVTGALGGGWRASA
ncbi:MAG: hypothetical protein JWL99_2068 [Streptomyces oryziradicis]|nr:hypothetical protein [Actinacidiphila oryziradicis]